MYSKGVAKIQEFCSTHGTEKPTGGNLWQLMADFKDKDEKTVLLDVMRPLANQNSD
jgi:hypothetical protein